MSDIAIRVENLTKKFFLGERVGIKTFREALQDLVTAPFRVWRKNGQGDGRDKVDTEREIWALKGVSFEVKHGEVLGIIGPNGAGKSTLLKILSRITEPTGGYAEIRGRVGSLLEVGTGFHPELTGRENVYLNGAILGMSKAEIRRKFDDIVSFAGVEKFIDTPVKRYSSGMQVRLAFAVAAHLDPEILIIDEVLAVGDAEFQKRCLGKMNEVARSGRTVLFVSHNMAAVEALCTQAILLKSGNIVAKDKVSDVVAMYLAGEGNAEASSSHTFSKSSVIHSVALVDQAGQPRNLFRIGESIQFVVETRTGVRLRDARIAFLVFNSVGILAMKCFSHHQYRGTFRISGPCRVSCVLRDVRLVPDSYLVDLKLFEGSTLIEEHPNTLQFSIAPTDIYGTGRLPNVRTGVYLPIANWNLTPLAPECLSS